MKLLKSGFNWVELLRPKHWVFESSALLLTSTMVTKNNSIGVENMLCSKQLLLYCYQKLTYTIHINKRDYLWCKVVIIIVWSVTKQTLHFSWSVITIMVWDYSINTHNASLLWQARNNTLRQLLFATVQYSKTVHSKAM